MRSQKIVEENENKVNELEKAESEILEKIAQEKSSAL